jgi:hypothetical protein
MQELQIPQVIELDQPVASAEYVVQIIQTMNDFSAIWEQQLQRHGQLARVKLTLNALDDLLADAERNHTTLQGNIKINSSR